MNDPADTEQRMLRLEYGLYGADGTNGLNGRMRELSTKLDAVEEKMSGLYKMLAVFALSLVASALGVVVTLLGTSGG